MDIKDNIKLAIDSDADLQEDIKIGIYCMEKDEDDILEQWILHHSKITSLENIHIIDNMSTSAKTHEILQKYISKGLNVCYEKDYKQKGTLIYNLIKRSNPDIAIPLDLDEFIYPLSRTESIRTLTSTTNASSTSNARNDIARETKRILYRLYIDYRDYNTTTGNNTTNNTTNNTNISSGRFAFKYYLTSENDKLYYNDPISEITKFSIVDLKSHNKKFFIAKCLTGLDHGHHTGTVANNSTEYTETDLILVHYHFRGILKLIEKCRNDIRGLKIVKNIDNVSELNTKISQNVPGSHNIKTYRDFLLYGAYYFTSFVT